MNSEAPTAGFPPVRASDGPSTVLTGRRLGVYSLLERVGDGAMGEVYRARDTRLGRDVAIKILPHAYANDADRVARFEREARVLASLHHPNIGLMYGFEDETVIAGSPVRGLVLEWVDGQTLEERIACGPVPLPEALAIARQIADALDSVHKKGIIHRDLKPGNVKVTPDGVVKVLDFGLATAGGDDATLDGTQSPTIRAVRTLPGVILGTAAYLSPEQARGEAVGKSTDIWAFGCLVFELLSGRSPFARDTIAETIAAIAERDPAWNTLPDGVPFLVRHLLQRCLEKDPGQRLVDVSAVVRVLVPARPSGAAGHGS